MFGTVSPAPFLPFMIGPLGMQEMLIILVVALIVFGPRKLPQIGKTLGKSIAEFRRTSTELRSTLEREVQMEEFRAARTEISGLGKDVSNLGPGLDPAGPRRGPKSGPAGSAGGTPAAPPAEPQVETATEVSAASAAGTPDAAAGDPRARESRQDTKE